jgi:hypothetical protein
MGAARLHWQVLKSMYAHAVAMLQRQFLKLYRSALQSLAVAGYQTACTRRLLTCCSGGYQTAMAGYQTAVAGYQTACTRWLLPCCSGRIPNCMRSWLPCCSGRFSTCFIEKSRLWKDHLKNDLRSDQDQDQDQRSIFAPKVPFLGVIF